MAGFYNCLKSNNDCIMATGPVDVLELPETEETGKKKSKFQTFKNFFAKKKKRKEPSSPVGAGHLKPSQSSSDVSAPNLDSSLLHLPKEPGSKGSMGSKALSHDSVFIFESSPEVVGKTCSHENLPGKVKSLQLQLQQNFQLGSPPRMITSKKAEDAGAVSEDDGLPRSPPEISTLHDVLTCSASKSCNLVQRQSSLSLGGTDSEDEQVPSEASSRPTSPLSSVAPTRPASPRCRLLPADFNSPATPLGCLDTSAAKHRIAINPRKQKAFASKNQNHAVELLETEQGLPVIAEGKRSCVKLLEAGSQMKEWEGLSILNASESWTHNMLPTTRTLDPLRYSWNAGPGVDRIRLPAPETHNCIGTDLKASVMAACPSAGSSLTKREEEMEEAGVKTTWGQRDSLKLNAQNSGKEAIETSESLQTETETSGLSDAQLSALYADGVGKDVDVSVERSQMTCPKPVDQKTKYPRSVKEARHVDRAKDRPGEGNSSVSLETDPALIALQFFSPTLEAPSEAKTPVVAGPPGKEDAGKPAETELPPFEDHGKPTPVLQEESAILDANVDSHLLQNAGGKKPFLPVEFHGPLLNSGLDSWETDVPRKTGNSSVGNLAASGSAEVAPQSSPHDDDDAREDQREGVKIEEKSKAPDETVKTPSRSASAKPVRFTIAPAWQRSLSGGSGSIDGSPSSPISPELFEAMPLLDTAAQGSLQNSLERLDRDHRNAAAILNAAMEWANVDSPNHESPFGVKLRRTSSLLKYQTEQQRHEPPKQLPLVASEGPSVSIKDELKSSGSRKPFQNLPSAVKPSVTKPGCQDEKNVSKAKLEEAATKQPMGKSPEQTAAAQLEPLSSEPTWISVAKQKQKGFQGSPLAKGHPKEEKPLVKTKQEREKRTDTSQQEKQGNPTGENVLKKSTTPHLRGHKTTEQLKMTASTTTEAPVRTSPQEAPRVGKETRPPPSLSISSCSPAEPPWLSLAKKKAKAWSEMPQIVQ
ncbi:acrosomal protein KIAA1210 homolog isoform X3 [Hemicordylus capensis]|uniref:acrosomal protein KIAA1210 homolog isoform X3 n=2 Tax=Hemicordylus capensis TaxID=884348 RepID=UPI002303A085|nr:acrosomal protein KIAA1210 homolog isoform X3 [Hemicordylus capensis]